MKPSLLTAFLAIAVFCAAIFSVPVTGHAEKAAKTEKAKPWNVRCAEKGGKKRCEIYQKIVVEDSGQRVVELIMSPKPDNANAMQAAMILPLGMYLPKGVELQIDTGSTQKYPVDFCIAGGCFASLPLSDDFLATMKDGTDLRVRFTDTSKKPYEIKMSLKGFNKAFQEMTKS